jgi:hypothetical protein
VGFRKAFARYGRNSSTASRSSRPQASQSGASTTARWAAALAEMLRFLDSEVGGRTVRVARKERAVALADSQAVSP